MNFILLQSFSNYIDAHILFGRLSETGINCWLKDENLVTINPLWANAAGGIKLMVAENQFEEASSLLAQFAEEKRKTFTCPHCNSGNIEYVSSERHPANWLSVILGFLFFSYAMPIKTWRCFDCKMEFREPKEDYNKEVF
jgi:hypothetical protein